MDIPEPGDFMTQNPYANFLGDANPIEVISSTAMRLASLTSGLCPEDTDAPIAPGKWSIRQLMVHLADCEIAFAFRLRQALAGVQIQPFDQDTWAENYDRYSLVAALDTFGAVRAWNVAFAKDMTADEKACTVNHPERGDMTVWTIIETMAGHDLNHLGQIERAARAVS